MQANLDVGLSQIQSDCDATRVDVFNVAHNKDGAVIFWQPGDGTMHNRADFGTFKLSFEPLDEPPRWLNELAHQQKLSEHLKILEEGVPTLF